MTRQYANDTLHVPCDPLLSMKLHIIAYYSVSVGCTYVSTFLYVCMYVCVCMGNAWLADGLT